MSPRTKRNLDYRAGRGSVAPPAAAPEPRTVRPGQPVETDIYPVIFRAIKQASRKYGRWFQPEYDWEELEQVLFLKFLWKRTQLESRPPAEWPAYAGRLARNALFDFYTKCFPERKRGLARQIQGDDESDAEFRSRMEAAAPAIPLLNSSGGVELHSVHPAFVPQVNDGLDGVVTVQPTRPDAADPLYQRLKHLENEDAFKDAFNRAVQVLVDLERNVLNYEERTLIHFMFRSEKRDGKAYRQWEIANMMRISEDRVSYLKRKVLGRLKKELEKVGITEYPGHTGYAARQREKKRKAKDGGLLQGILGVPAIEK
jgi:hypothetical protein